MSSPCYSILVNGESLFGTILSAGPIKSEQNGQNYWVQKAYDN